MKYELKLYIVGHALSSQRAIVNLNTILNESGLEGKCNLEIIDISENPQLAEEEKIIATPVLIRKSPPPARKIVGDLGDKEKVLLGLDLVPEN